MKISKTEIFLFLIVTLVSIAKGVQFRYEEGPVLGPILFVTFNWILFFIISFAIERVRRLFAKQ